MAIGHEHRTKSVTDRRQVSGAPRGSRDTRRRIFVVDPEAVTRRGLAQLIGECADLSVCGEAEDKSRALKGLAALKPDIVILDITLSENGGNELVRRIVVDYPRIPVLVFTHRDETVHARRAVRAGARGYVMKNESAGTILEAVRTVLAGEIYLSGEMARRMFNRLVNGAPSKGTPLVSHLSDRELQVFELIGQLIGSREIAEKLQLSVKTVNTHRAHIRRKLTLKNSSELVQNAVDWVHGS